MERQVAALFVHDANGRLTQSRSSGGEGPAPDALVSELARLASAEPAPGDLDALPERHAVMRERLAAAAPVEHVFHGAAFRFPEALPASTGVRELTEADTRLLEESFPELAASLAERAPCFAVVEDHRAVSVCYAATSWIPRTPATQRAACVEAGVETLPGFEGRGLASRAVAAWARGVRARGADPLYSASLGNRASLGVARRLGLIRYGSALHMR